MDLRQELAQVALAAHLAATLMPVPAQQCQATRRAAWVTALRLVSAEFLLLLMRNVRAGSSSELRWSLDAAIAAIALAGPRGSRLGWNRRLRC
jgi:hypothetical protein